MMGKVRVISGVLGMQVGDWVAYEDYAKLQAQVDALEADGGAAAWILEWMVAEQYRKPDIPVIVRKAHKHYKDTLAQVAQLQAQVDRVKIAADALADGAYRDYFLAAIKGEGDE